MNKKNNRKGFTIVELVIVIAVIAILATVLVPTFGSVISDAKNSALVQEIKNEHTNYTMKHATDDNYSEDVIIRIGEKFYKYVDGTIEMNDDEKTPKAYTEEGITKEGVIAAYYNADIDLLQHFYADEDAEGAKGHGFCDDCGVEKEKAVHNNHTCASTTSACNVEGCKKAQLAG